MRTKNTSLKDVWETPPEIINMIEEGDTINTDPCAGPDTYIGRDYNYRGINYDGIHNPWVGSVFVNMPFSQKKKWLRVAIQKVKNARVDRVYAITPDSTDTKSWWHKYIAPNANLIWFSEGRIGYINPETKEKAKSPTFGTAISVFGSRPPDATIRAMSDKGHLVETIR